MARDPNALASGLDSALDAGFRNRLVARGQAQSMIRRNGMLPNGSPEFSTYLDADLLNYGYSLLVDGLAILDGIEATKGVENMSLAQAEVARKAFIQSSYAMEAATRNAADAPDQTFHRLLSGAGSHLGGYAARAFSLTAGTRESGELTPIELTLADLMLRDIGAVEERTQLLRSSSLVSDDYLLSALAADNDVKEDPLGPVALLLSEAYLSSVSSALYGIEIGNRALLADALKDLSLGEQAALDVGAPGPWWVYRLTRRMLGDLFDTSLRTNIPIAPPSGSSEDAPRWRYLRQTFIENLLARGRSEIDLWPSQLHVVDRIFADGRDLVVALPTSAGKTRIAELAILACLARGMRTVYVTPLRALSAQTEQILGRTFVPLGARVSSLYGSMGTSDIDDDSLRSSEIVVATPEKLDFAIRSDPSVLDDVGLIVLDEGHMIGASEREVRYEAQVQRLLRRADASARRIVCLSAVFPSGADLEDFVAWITNDEPEGLHRETWRPTSQRFGLVEWLADHARLVITLGSDQPFIPRYIESRQAPGARTKQFPADQRELVIATAWRLVEEGQTVLIFCPQRNSVEPYAREVLKLHRQGLLTSVLPADVDLSGALVVGAEWFGANHPILKCLELGVAIHHGALPAPFRREVEKLLHEGKLKVTVASPTLAQGLNLSASAVLFHGLKRGRDTLKSSDFSNVIGRAGRAFVDTEGLVLYPIFEPDGRKRERLRRDWIGLTQGDGGKALDSGLIQVGSALIRRMHDSRGGGSIEPFLDYLTGGLDWTLPVLPRESASDEEAATDAWRSNLSLLDIGILSTLGDGAYDADPDAASQALSDALVDSLWERQLRRREGGIASAIRELVTGRVRNLWETSTASQRRGWYLAGLGADAGRGLAAISGRVVDLMGQVEVALFRGDQTAASDGLIEVASAVFEVDTFAPEVAVDDWRGVLRHWVGGLSLADLPGDRVAIARFVESDLVYRLVWGMEAARVYESAQGNELAETLDGSAVTSIETGTFNSSASILIRSGFDHRLAAVHAVTSTGAAFESAAEMRRWIEDLDPWYANNEAWPAPESRPAWLAFASHVGRGSLQQWRRRTDDVHDVTWYGEVPDRGTWLRITDFDSSTVQIWSPGFDLLGEATLGLNSNRLGILRAQRLAESSGIRLMYRGPRDLYSSSPA
jgi:superfamily II DNA/RNA helicase